MNDFIDSSFNYISLTWYDLILLFSLITFTIIGFKKGFIKELISLLCLVASIFIATILYKGLADFIFALIQVTKQNYLYATTFAILLCFAILIKVKTYKLFKKISYIDNPCDLNTYLAKIVFWLVVITISWSYTSDLFNSQIMSTLIVNEVIKYWLSFALILITIISLSRFTIKVFNITMDNEKECVMEYVYSKFLLYIKKINNVINTSSKSTLNKLLGATIAFINNLIFLLIIVLILQSFEFINQQLFWINAQGILLNLQNVLSEIEPFIFEKIIFIDVNNLNNIISDITI